MLPRSTPKLIVVPFLIFATLLAGLSSSFAAGLRLNLLVPDTLITRLREGQVRAKERQAVVERMFKDVGCDVDRQQVGRKSSNVICDLRGNTNDTIIVGAHFDFVERGQGIVDDWSGTAMLVSLYETLRFGNPRHSYEFVAFAAEESGLLGSTQYVKQMRARPDFNAVAFVNLECLGLTPPKVWVKRSSPVLAGRLLEIANAMHIPVAGVNVDRVGDDDTHPFLSNKIPVISIHSLTQETWPILHSPRDSLSAINSVYYYDAYRLLAFYLDYLDQNA